MFVGACVCVLVCVGVGVFSTLASHRIARNTAQRYTMCTHTSTAYTILRMRAPDARRDIGSGVINYRDKEVCVAGPAVLTGAVPAACIHNRNRHTHTHKHTLERRTPPQAANVRSLITRPHNRTIATRCTNWTCSKNEHTSGFSAVLESIERGRGRNGWTPHPTPGQPRQLSDCYYLSASTMQSRMLHSCVKCL